MSTPDPTPLSSARAVVALLGLFDDHAFVHKLVSAFPTWDDLVKATAQQRAALTDPRALRMRVPPTCPDMPPRIRAVTRYDETYPVGLRALEEPPVAVFFRGALDDAPVLLVDGSRSPSPQGVEIARSAALAAATKRVPLLVRLAEGAPMAALQTAVAAQARTLVLVPHSLDVPTVHARTMDLVLNEGGAVLSLVHPANLRARTPDAQMARVVVALSRAVVLAEVGLTDYFGADVARAVVDFGRFLIVPNPPAHHVPASAEGLAVLSDPRQFSAQWYGTSARISARVQNAQTPADAVVSNPTQIAIAVAVACAPR